MIGNNWEIILGNNLEIILGNNWDDDCVKLCDQPVHLSALQLHFSAGVRHHQVERRSCWIHSGWLLIQKTIQNLACLLIEKKKWRRNPKYFPGIVAHLSGQRQLSWQGIITFKFIFWCRCCWLFHLAFRGVLQYLTSLDNGIFSKLQVVSRCQII